MKYIIRNAKVVQPTSKFHNQTVDIEVTNGKITQINTETITLDNSKEYNEIQLDNLHVSEGWFDESVSFGEPGFEERETLENGLEVAAKSGFTQVAVQPNNIPITDNQTSVAFLKNKSQHTTTQILPIGALTHEMNGEDLAELYDMQNAGAIAFGDYKKAITNANLLKIALQYVQDFDGLILSYANTPSISGKGVVNEGRMATLLGMKGIPTLSEELNIARDLFLLEYTGGKIHFPTISSAKSVDLIRKAKKKGLDVSCSVAVHHLFLTDEVLDGFDTRYKVAPPLRNEENRKALIEGVLDNTIESVTSDHRPLDIEHKKMEFDLAKDGTIGLESAFGALLKVLPLEVVIEKLTTSKQLFGQTLHHFEVGSDANFTLFNPEKSYTFTEKHILSKSKNSAFLNQNLIGEVYGSFHQNKCTLK